MTGSSGYIYDNNSTESSIESFNSALDDKIEPRTRNVFISFHMEDEDKVNLLRYQAKNNQFGIHFRDYSVKEPFDDAWKRRCSERIALTSATIVMIGPETASREAVNWEINESLRQGKKVIGVRMHKYENHRVPRQMIENDCPIIDWNLARISRQLDRD